MTSSYAGKIAVITGAASGIGKELAKLGARNGMRLVLADLSKDQLEDVGHELRTVNKMAEKDIICVKTDVSKEADVANLSVVTSATLGTPNFVFNNAGVAGSSGFVWENTVDDWNWIMGINLMGVVHGIRSFTPIMLKEASSNPSFRGRFVNTASMAGFSSMPLAAMYNVTKHGVVTLSETMYHDLKLITDQVDVSVLCPFFIPTAIGSDSSGHRGQSVLTPSQKIGHMNTMKAVSSGKISAEMVAQQVFDGIESNLFYIFTHQAALVSAKERIDDIVGGRNPRSPYHAKPELGEKLKEALRKAYLK